MTNNKTKCVMSDCGIGIENSGHIKMCNASIDVFKNNKNEPCRLDKDNLKDIWNSKTRKEIGNALDNGIRHENCRLCWDAEDSGVTSIRQFLNKTFHGLSPIKEQPRVVIIKPGNQCNLGCRTCNAEASNQLYKIDYELDDSPSGISNHYEWYKEKFSKKNKTKPSFEDYVDQFNSQRDSFKKDNNVWQTLDEWSAGIAHYALFGGEPFVMKPLFDLLDQSNLKGHTLSQDLYISTNATIWSEKYMNIIKNFKSACIGLSIDSIRDQFEYIRYPANWIKVKENILKFAEFREKNKNISLKVSATCNPFNIYYLDELYDFFKDLKISVDIHLIQIPEHYDIRIFPQEVKDEISKKYKDRRDLDNVVTFLNSNMVNAELHLKDFVYYTQGTDRIRQQKFGNVFPEFNKILIKNNILI
jgi:MoaA/NifB/PqqE/SkfB family radical SAM enzyme